MKLDLTGLRIEVTDAIRSFTEKKIKKIGRASCRERVSS